MTASLPVRLAYNQQEAAAQLSVSVNHFVKYVRPHLKEAYIGGVVRYSAVELQRYLNKVKG